MYFNYDRPPSYVVLIYSYHMPIPLQSRFMYLLVISPTFVVSLILSFLILSSFVTPHIHRSILISATSNLFSCAFFNAHVSAPYNSAGLITVLYIFPLIFTFILLSDNTPYTLFQFFILLCTLLWVTSASSYPSSVNVDSRYVNVITLFTVSSCNWIYAY